MNIDQILKLPSMPAACPSYPLGPYRFINREYMIITYETDHDLLRAAVPEPLVPNAEGHVLYEWIRMPDSSGFGDYTESGIVIPCTFEGEVVNYTAQMYLDDEPPISAGICQLVAFNLIDISIKGSWISPARLQLIPHVNAPVADLPIKKVIGGKHYIGDLTLPHGRVLFDFVKDQKP